MIPYLHNPINIADPRFVDAFDELPFWSSRFGALLMRHIPLRAGMRALDVGCGAGFPLIELADALGASCQVVGLDPWLDALGRARLKLNA